MMTLDDIFITLLDLSGKLDKTQQSLDAAQQKVAELQAILNTKGGFKLAIHFNIVLILYSIVISSSRRVLAVFKARDSRKR